MDREEIEKQIKELWEQLTEPTREDISYMTQIVRWREEAGDSNPVQTAVSAFVNEMEVR